MDYILSLILPGLGHLYRRMYGRAVGLFLALGLHGGILWLAARKGQLGWLAVAKGVEARYLPGYWVSTGILMALFGGIWGWTLWDLRRSRHPKETTGRSYWSVVWRRFSRDPKGLTGAVIILAVLYLALFSPFLSPYDPLKMDFLHTREPPGHEHWFGTDNFGRDVLSRTIYGARTALGIGAVATLFNMLLGGILGVLGGFYRGPTDAVVMRILEVVNAIPYLVLVILAVSLFGSSIPVVIIVLGIFGLQPARIVRSEVLSVREEDYVMSARAVGVSPLRLILHHVMPNAIATLLVTGTMLVGVNIVTVAGLGFLGLGITPPTPDWGAMLGDAQEFFRTAWWMAVFPGLFIVITVFGFNVLGDSLRDVMDPRLM